MWSYVSLKSWSSFHRSATHLTDKRLCHYVYALKVPLYVLSTSRLFVTHTTVICFVLSQRAHSRDVAVKLSMLQKHCKMRNSQAKLKWGFYYWLYSLSQTLVYTIAKIQQFLCVRMCLLKPWRVLREAPHTSQGKGTVTMWQLSMCLSTTCLCSLGLSHTPQA